MFVINWILFEIISTIPHSNAIVNRGLLFRCTHIYNMYLWCVGVSASVSVPSTEAAGTLKVCCLSVLRFFPLLLVIVLHDIRYSLMVVVCVCPCCISNILIVTIETCAKETIINFPRTNQLQVESSGSKSQLTATFLIRNFHASKFRIDQCNEQHATRALHMLQHLEYHGNEF